MDHLNLDFLREPPRPEPVEAAADRPVADPERAFWAQFSEASTPEAFLRSWLALQCRMIAGVSGGLVLLGTPDRGPFTPAAIWPSAQRSMKHLTAAAERALVERRGLLLKRDANGHPGALAHERYDVAYPIEVAGRLHGVVVLDVAPRPEPQLQAVLRQLHWGSAWLEVLFRREEAATDAAIKERLQAVLDLVATVFGHDGYYAAAMAFITATATRLGCDRVSVGFVRGGRTGVGAVSPSISRP